MSADSSSTYLEVERGVPADVIDSDRFHGCFRVDDQMNVAFRPVVRRSSGSGGWRRAATRRVRQSGIRPVGRVAEQPP
jgi:hypothetical protein